MPIDHVRNIIQISPLTDPSPNQEPTNSERELVCGDWHSSKNTDHPHTVQFDPPSLKSEVSRMVSIG